LGNFQENNSCTAKTTAKTRARGDTGKNKIEQELSIIQRVERIAKALDTSVKRLDWVGGGVREK